MPNVIYSLSGERATVSDLEARELLYTGRARLDETPAPSESPAPPGAGEARESEPVPTPPRARRGRHSFKD